MDATMFLYRAELSAVRNQRVLAYCLADTKRMKGIHNDEIMQGITEEGVSVSRSLTPTSNTATSSMRSPSRIFHLRCGRILRFDDSVAHSKRYFEEQVLLYEMLKGGEISKKDKDTLVDTILSRLYFEGIKKIRGGTERDGFMVGDFYAELPLSEVMHKVAHDAGITWKDKDKEKLLDDIEAYAKTRA